MKLSRQDSKVSYTASPVLLDILVIIGESITSISDLYCIWSINMNTKSASPSRLDLPEMIDINNYSSEPFKLCELKIILMTCHFILCLSIKYVREDLLFGHSILRLMERILAYVTIDVEISESISVLNFPNIFFRLMERI